ncbi:MAG: hypothetical protein COA74_11080 [Gammaproteobacteria bacterium]|nr:MAG: hypothetical protein COA74_11080 [Gammaproteobacteria bacterium]
MTIETKIWSGSPSQVVNIIPFILSVLFIWLIFPLFIILWKWLVTKTTTYELTNQRLTTRSGVFNKTVDELELYRIKDHRLDQPFFLRIFSLGNIILDTSDKTHPTVVISAISNVDKIRGDIRTFVEERRDNKRVREVDFE